MRYKRIIGLLVLLLLSIVGYGQSLTFTKNADGTWTMGGMMPDYDIELAVEYEDASGPVLDGITFTKNADGTWTMDAAMPDYDIELVVEYEDAPDGITFTKNADGTWTMDSSMPDYDIELVVEYEDAVEPVYEDITFTQNADGTWTMDAPMPDYDIELVVEYEDAVGPEDFAGNIWQEYTAANGTLYEANETGKTVTITPSAETPGIVDIAYPAFKMAGSNEKLYGFTVSGVNRYEFADGTIYYELTEPKITQIRSRMSTLVCNATLVGVQSSSTNTPALKLILTGRRTQFEDIVWFGPDDLSLNQVKALIDVMTGISPLGETEEEAAIYNLAGQRLSKPQKGINIIGGKKVLVK